MHTNPTSTVLRTLIDTVQDSIKGYRQSADAAQSPDIRALFDNRIERREMTLDRLNAELTRLGGEMDHDGSTAGALHRVWTRITAMLDSGDEAVVDRVEEGESYLADKFETALEDDSLDPQARQVIESGLREIREGERLAEQLGAKLH